MADNSRGASCFAEVLIALVFSVAFAWKSRSVKNVQSFRITWGRHRETFMANMIGEYDIVLEDQLVAGDNSDEGIRVERTRKRLFHINRLSVGATHLALSTFFVVIVLLYEVSVVNHIFEKRQTLPVQDPRNLHESDLFGYVIESGTAMEHIWTHTVMEGKFEDTNATKPWKGVNNDRDVYNYILDNETHSDTNFGITYNVSMRNIVQEPKEY